jgi:hypothetical protein
MRRAVVGQWIGILAYRVSPLAVQAQTSTAGTKFNPLRDAYLAGAGVASCLTLW